MLESVQERATKLVDGMGNLDYTERLRKLELPTLQFRRQHGNMILDVWKHFNSYYRSTLSSSFKPIVRVIRKHPLQLIRNRAKDGTRGVQNNSFYFRIAKDWNELDPEVAKSQNINTFKARLDVAWKDKANKFTIEKSSNEDEELFGEVF